MWSHCRSFQNFLIPYFVHYTRLKRHWNPSMCSMICGDVTINHSSFWAQQGAWGTATEEGNPFAKWNNKKEMRMCMSINPNSWSCATKSEVTQGMVCVSRTPLSVLLLLVHPSFDSSPKFEALMHPAASSAFSTSPSMAALMARRKEADLWRRIYDRSI